MEQNVEKELVCTSIPLRILIFIYITSLCSITNSFPIQIENSTISDVVENRTIDINSTQWPMKSNPKEYVIKPRRVTVKEWMRMVNRGPLVTQVAFDIGPRFSPTFAYITHNSYGKFMEDLEEKCRKPADENIADVRLDNLDNEYFRWEEFQFNKALLHTLFPETIQRDHSRFLESKKVTKSIRLSAGLESQCQVVEQNDEEWSNRVDEKTQFEDYLINRIFQPRLFGEHAQAIINEIEGKKGQSDEEDQIGRRHYRMLDSNSNLTDSTNSTLLDRKKREIRPLSRKQREEIARLRFREYKATRV